MAATICPHLQDERARVCVGVMDSPRREGIKVAVRSSLARRNPGEKHQNVKQDLIAIRDDRSAKQDTVRATPLPLHPLISLRAFNRFGFTLFLAHLSP